VNTNHCSPGNASRIAAELRRAACELYVVGASVSTQRDGWPSRLAERLGRETGHGHTVSKCVMGGVGMLFALAYLDDQPPLDRTRIALIEFSTGDLNFGHVPLAQLESWIRELLHRLTASGALPLVIHNWRSDHEIVDKHGIRATYDRVAAEFGVSVIANHRWIAEEVAAARIDTKLWFRDVCHTTALGAQGYAEHIADCLLAPPGDVQSMPATVPAANPTAVSILEVMELAASQRVGVRREFVYTATDARYTALVLEADESLELRLSGDLLGVAMLSGPRSTWVSVEIDGKPFKKLRAFDRNSHYERFILPICIGHLHDAAVVIRCAPDVMDMSIAAQSHPDFLLPRQLALVGFVGRDLRLT
jgi:lysophospholipase L1-like esterase